jgi:putative flippase GtrA
MFAKSRFVRFFIVGSIGFGVDAVLLSTLVNALGWSPFAARVVSFSAALGVTWYLNRSFTFRDRAAPRAGPEAVRYVLVQVSGALLNYGTFSALVVLFAQAARWPILALVPASALAMCFNYLGMYYFAFRRPPLNPAHE